MPLKAGDWIYDDSLIGKVKYVHDDGLLDIIIYDRTGEKIGRVSDPLDGPTGFEPCCDPDGWKKILPPQFPLKRHHYLHELVVEA